MADEFVGYFFDSDNRNADYLPIWKELYFRNHPEEDYSLFTRNEILRIANYFRRSGEIPFEIGDFLNPRLCWKRIRRACLPDANQQGWKLVEQYVYWHVDDATRRRISIQDVVEPDPRDPKLHYRVSVTAFRGLEQFYPNFAYIGQLQQVKPVMIGDVRIMDQQLINRVLEINRQFCGVVTVEEAERRLRRAVQNEHKKYICLEISQHDGGGHATSCLLIRGGNNHFSVLYYDSNGSHLYDDRPEYFRLRDGLLGQVRERVFNPIQRDRLATFEDFAYLPFITQAFTPICTQLSMLFIIQMVTNNLLTFEDYENYLCREEFEYLVRNGIVNRMVDFEGLRGAPIRTGTMADHILLGTRVYGRCADVMCGVLEPQLYCAGPDERLAQRVAGRLTGRVAGPEELLLERVRLLQQLAHHEFDDFGEASRLARQLVQPQQREAQRQRVEQLRQQLLAPPEFSDSWSDDDSDDFSDDDFGGGPEPPEEVEPGSSMFDDESDDGALDNEPPQQRLDRRGAQLPAWQPIWPRQRRPETPWGSEDSGL